MMNVYDEIYKKRGLSPTQQEILNIVGKNKIVLEIGPATGYMTKAFLENGCTLDVVEINKEAVSKIPKKVRKIFNQSIESTATDKLLNADYEYIVMADVLEHLVAPEKTLQALSKMAGKKTSLLVSLPNIASWVIRKQLFFKGDFEYQESGPLDKTHLHFYTFETAPKLLSENGWKVEKILGTITRLPFEETLSKIPILGWMIKKLLYPQIAERYKNLSYYHFLVIASK